jgi:hypothetical protein
MMTGLCETSRSVGVAIGLILLVCAPPVTSAAAADPQTPAPTAAPSTDAGSTKAEPPADQPRSKLDTVTVEGQRERAALARRVKKFVSAITQVPFEDSLAQWETANPLCFAVAGMTRDYGVFTLDRLSKIAEAAGAPLAPDGCKPNFYVIATAVPDELVAAWAKHYYWIFGHAGPKKIDDFATAATPIRVWYNVVPFSADGSPCSTISVLVAPGTFEGAPMCDQLDTHLRWGTVRDLSSVIVLIDTRRTKGITLNQLAAYIAMVGLAEIRTDPKVGDAPTILRVFSDSAQAPAEGLSAWDSAYLKALYHTSHSGRTQFLDVGKSMVAEIAP